MMAKNIFTVAFIIFSCTVLGGNLFSQDKADVDQKLIGKWECSQDGVDVVVTLNADGTFISEANSGPSRMTGRWKIQDNNLMWYYDQANSVFKAGEPDVNPIIEVTEEKFKIKEINGMITSYIRINAAQSFEDVLFSGTLKVDGRIKTPLVTLDTSSPYHCLNHDVNVTISKVSLPAPLPRGMKQLAPPVKIEISDEKALMLPLRLFFTYDDSQTKKGEGVAMALLYTTDIGYEPTTVLGFSQGTLATESLMPGIFVVGWVDEKDIPQSGHASH